MYSSYPQFPLALTRNATTVKTKWNLTRQTILSITQCSPCKNNKYHYLQSDDLYMQLASSPPPPWLIAPPPTLLERNLKGKRKKKFGNLHKTLTADLGFRDHCLLLLFIFQNAHIFLITPLWYPARIYWVSREKKIPLINWIQLFMLNKVHGLKLYHNYTYCNSMFFLHKHYFGFGLCAK